MIQEPILVVVFNNGCYNANKAPLISAYRKGLFSAGASFRRHGPRPRHATICSRPSLALLENASKIPTKCCLHCVAVSST